MYALPVGSFIVSGQSKIVAKNARGFYALYGKYPDFEIDSTDDNISDFSQTVDLTKHSSWGTGSLSLTNTGDEIILLDANDVVVDAVVFEGGIHPGTLAHSGVTTGHSIARDPIDEDTNNCNADFKDKKNPQPGYDWIYETENGFTQIGLVADDGNAENEKYLSAERDLTTAGYLYFGPYDHNFAAGNYQVNFRLKVNDKTISDPVVRIDAHNNGGSGWYVWRDIKGIDFANNNIWQNFDLWWERVDEGNMEFRVWFFDNANVGLDNIMVSEADRQIYEAEELWHNSGTLVLDPSASNGKAWQAATGDNINHMLYGPYNDLASGNYEVVFVTKVSDNTISNNVVTFDVNNTFGTDHYKRKVMRGTDFSTNNVWLGLGIGFSRIDAGVMEYRAFYEGNTTVTIDNVIVIAKNKVRYEAEDLYGATGVIVNDVGASDGQIRQARAIDHAEGWIQFGPYTTDQVAGSYRATFHLKTNDKSNVNNVARISVFNAGGSGVEQALDIKGTDFAANNTWQDFTLDFDRVNEGSMEFRVYFYDTNDVSVDWVEVGRIS